jgi:hypothetical protein
MLRNGHVRFGGRAAETDPARAEHRAAARPNSRLKNYGSAVGLEQEIGEFADAIAMRHVLAYRLPQEIDDDIVWRASIDDLPTLRQAVREALLALAE